MDAAAKRGSGINLGFLAPLTPFRHFVMGEESMERGDTGRNRKIKASLKKPSPLARWVHHQFYCPTYWLQGRPLACRQANMESLRRTVTPSKLGRVLLSLR
jgi:hypothetical protein